MVLFLDADSHSDNFCAIQKKVWLRLPHRLLKHRLLSPTILFRATTTRTVTFNLLKYKFVLFKSYRVLDLFELVRPFSSLLFKPYLTTLFVRSFLVVFFDSSTSCLLVWTENCCRSVVETWCKRQRWRQGDLVIFFNLSNYLLPWGRYGKVKFLFA